MNNPQAILNAKSLVREQHSGVLSTHSLSMKGYPFGSIVPYFMTSEGNLIIYISQIAQHTRNINANEKVSMTIFNALEDDSQAAGRVTVLGDARLIEDKALQAQYLALFPQAEGYQQTHDFHFYEIVTQRVRYIGGFGQIFWISRDDWQSQLQMSHSEWQAMSEGVVRHMNDDHQAALALIIEHQFQRQVSAVQMLSNFPEGMHVRADGQVYFVAYEQPCFNPQQVRAQLVAATQAARQALAEPA